MTQGKPLDKDRVLETLRPFFERGLSVNMACNLAGYDPSMVYKWLKADEELAREIKATQNIVTLNALTHKVKAVERGDKADVDWWLGRNKRIREEFTERTELTGANGAALPTPIINIQRGDNNKDKENSDGDVSNTETTPDEKVHQENGEGQSTGDTA